MFERDGIIYIDVNDRIRQLSPIIFRETPDNPTRQFRELAHQHGLPGVVSDHLPGECGLHYMDRFFMDSRGTKPGTLERLAFIGSNALGGAGVLSAAVQ